VHIQVVNFQLKDLSDRDYRGACDDRHPGPGSRPLPELIPGGRQHSRRGDRLRERDWRQGVRGGQNSGWSFS
jgi:hypothetical protein